MIKKEKIFKAVFYTFLSVALVFGLMALNVEQNSYKTEPSFLYYGVITNLLPLIAGLTLIIYYKQVSSKVKNYYWLSAGIVYCLGIIIWHIVQNKTIQDPLAPADLLSPINMYGSALGVYNILVLLPLAVILALAAISYVLKPAERRFGLNSPWLTIIASVGIILITFSLRYAELKIVSGDLNLGSLSRRSIIEGNFRELSKSDDDLTETIYLDLYNTVFSYEQLNFGFIVDTTTKVYDSNGSNITLTDLKSGDKIKVIYNPQEEVETPIPVIYREK